MATKLEQFPNDEAPSTKRRYPWGEWADGSAWEIRQGEDYDVATENMRVNLHLKADSLSGKVRTTKISDDKGEGLVFQFLPSEEEELVAMNLSKDPSGTATALEQLYVDAVEIYDRAREEVMIPRKDGSWQKYAAVRFQAADRQGA